MNQQSRHGGARISMVRMRALATTLALVALITANFTVAAHAQIRKGNVLIPKSSIELPGDIGVRAHTHLQILIGPPGGRAGFYGGGGPGGGLTPGQLRQAYNLPSTGGSQIIALVDAYDNPTALADFNTFATQFGLPTESSSNPTASSNKVFQVLYANGTQPSQDSGWDLEESLDVQWAHAMAPNAKILLVEANSQSLSDLFAAVDAATNYVDGNGLTAKEISNSWGVGEGFGEKSADIHFSGTSAVYFASAGDNGAPAGYPSASPYVISAGGTTVNTDSNGNFTSETGWADGGGGPSAVEPIPLFQNGIALIAANFGRGTPDISYDADPNTGVSVYFAGSWYVVGGTSVSSPALAGIANLAATAKGVFPAGSQILLSTIYNNLGTANFRDITSGNNGYAAGTGWDFVTGVGSCLGLGGLTPIGTLIANPQSVAVPLGAPTLVTLTGSDPGNPQQPLTFAIGRQPVNGTLSGLNSSTGAVTYTPNSNFKGSDSFQFTVNTNDNSSNPASVKITVGPGTPTANPQTVAVPLGSATPIVLTGSDPDVPALPLTFALATLPSHGTLSNHNTATGDVTYTPNPGFEGQDSFTFAASNGFNHSGLATVTLNVAPGTPTANSQSVSVAYNSASKITLTGADPDTPALPVTYAIASQPAHGTLSGLNSATGAVTYTPASNFHGADSFTFTVSNGTNKSAPATVALTVAPGTPTAHAQTVSVKHSAATKITLTGSDPDSPPLPLTFAISSAPTHGSLSGLNSATGAVVYTPSTNFQGTDTFTFTVSNGTNASAPATVTLSVAAGKPTATPKSVTVTHKSAAQITLSGLDPDNPPLPLTFAIASSPKHGTLSGFNSTTGAVTYTPAANFQGSDTFTFTVSNGVNTSAAATVTLKVAAGTPTANPQTVTVVLNTTTTITLSGSDSDVPALPLTFAIATKPTHGVLGSLSATTGVVTYTPKANYKGADTFTFIVSNGQNKSAPATITLNVGGS